MNTAQAGGNPEAVFCTHLNRSVQGKVSARHGRVALFSYFDPCLQLNILLSKVPVHASNKKKLRSRLRALRRDLNAEEQASASRGLLDQLVSLDIFLNARRIGLYWANDGEIGTGQIKLWCQQNRRQAYLPIVQTHENRHWLLFGEWREGVECSPNIMGIPEPILARSDMLSAKALDLVILPLVGFDAQGNRIGMGGGYYDTTFEYIRQTGVDKPALIGIAHEIQRVTHIDVESWDIPLPMVVTDRSIYRF